MTLDECEQFVNSHEWRELSGFYLDAGVRDPIGDLTGPNNFAWHGSYNGNNRGPKYGIGCTAMWGYWANLDGFWQADTGEQGERTEQEHYPHFCIATDGQIPREETTSSSIATTASTFAIADSGAPVEYGTTGSTGCPDQYRPVENIKDCVVAFESSKLADYLDTGDYQPIGTWFQKHNEGFSSYPGCNYDDETGNFIFATARSFLPHKPPAPLQKWHRVCLLREVSTTAPTTTPSLAPTAVPGLTPTATPTTAPTATPGLADYGYTLHAANQWAGAMTLGVGETHLDWVYGNQESIDATGSLQPERDGYVHCGSGGVRLAEMSREHTKFPGGQNQGTLKDCMDYCDNELEGCIGIYANDWEISGEKTTFETGNSYAYRRPPGFFHPDAPVGYCGFCDGLVIHADPTVHGKNDRAMFTVEKTMVHTDDTTETCCNSTGGQCRYGSPTATSEALPGRCYTSQGLWFEEAVDTCGSWDQAGFKTGWHQHRVSPTHSDTHDTDTNYSAHCDTRIG